MLKLCSGLSYDVDDADGDKRLISQEDYSMDHVNGWAA
jgi:hypothetical protein